MPIGSTVEMIGVNCAACHVGELRFKGAAIRVDGAPSLFDINGFYAEMFHSAGDTLRDRVRQLEDVIAGLTPTVGDPHREGRECG